MNISFDLQTIQKLTKAAFNLGKIYEEGYSVNRNFEKASEYYKAAAEEGSIDAMYALSDLYEKQKKWNKKE